jgi:hypothetical protein
LLEAESQENPSASVDPKLKAQLSLKTDFVLVVMPHFNQDNCMLWAVPSQVCWVLHFHWFRRLQFETTPTWTCNFKWIAKWIPVLIPVSVGVRSNSQKANLLSDIIIRREKLSVWVCS